MLVERVTIEHQGRRSSALGAVVTPLHAAGYPRFLSDFVGSAGVIEASTGKVLGTARVVSRWSTPRSFVSHYMLQVEATIEGVKYTGRSGGTGMLWRGKRRAKQ